MEWANFEMEAWQLNQAFNKIKNCKVVKPPYEKDWYYSNKFFLDKRSWTTSTLSSAWKTFLDSVNIKWQDYYLFKEWDKHYIGWFNAWILTKVTSTGFTVDETSPIKLVVSRWIYWQSSWERTVSTEVTIGTGDTWFEWTLVPWYAGGYVKFKYSGTQNAQKWDFVVFSGNTALIGWINRIEHVEWDYIYIIGTNARWTLPKTWGTFYLYKSVGNGWTAVVGNTISIGHINGVSTIILNGLNEAVVLNPLTGENIKDLVVFDWNLFALSENFLYFTRGTFGSNTQFYMLDYYTVDQWVKLFPIGKALLLLARTNKLYAAANGAGTNVGYVGYDVNYQWTPFSKYSMIFDDQTIYILQADRQLKQIDIQQNNATTFDLLVKDALVWTKWLFNNLNWWEIFINNSQRYLQFLYVKDNKTINYQYDKMYQHFIENEYPFKIYKFTNKILSTGNIFIESGTTDNWIEFEQEINFMHDTTREIYMPYILRTVFGLTDTPIDVNMEVTLELGWKLDSEIKKLTGFNFDNRLSNELTVDDLLGSQPLHDIAEYNWTTVSIQSGIYRTWRFINYKYSSYKRFMIGNSYVLYDKAKVFINEPHITN